MISTAPLPRCITQLPSFTAQMVNQKNITYPSQSKSLSESEQSSEGNLANCNLDRQITLLIIGSFYLRIAIKMPNCNLDIDNLCSWVHPSTLKWPICKEKSNFQLMTSWVMKKTMKKGLLLTTKSAQIHINPLCWKISLSIWFVPIVIFRAFC